MKYELWVIADVWTRYTLAIPAALLAAAGLVVQQRIFRKSGLIQFGRDALWAAVSFSWYGLAGQIFVHESSLFPSTILNQNLFLEIFGFPINIPAANNASPTGPKKTPNILPMLIILRSITIKPGTNVVTKANINPILTNFQNNGPFVWLSSDRTPT